MLSRVSTATSLEDDEGVAGANATLRMGIGAATVVPLIGGGTTCINYTGKQVIAGEMQTAKAQSVRRRDRNID